MKLFKEFRIPVALLALSIASWAVLKVHDTLFLHLEDVTKKARSAEQIEFAHNVIFPSTCHLSLNGWGSGPADWAADQYLTIKQIEVTLKNENGLKSIKQKEDSLGIFYFEIAESGNLQVKIQKYNPPTPSIVRVDVEFACKSQKTFILAVIPFVTAIISLIASFLTFAWILWRRFQARLKTKGIQT